MKAHIIAKDCVNILVNRVLPMVEMLFPNGDVFSQGDKEPVYTVPIVQDWFQNMRINYDIYHGHNNH